jgi:hypothetical protein
MFCTVFAKCSYSSAPSRFLRSPGYWAALRRRHSAHASVRATQLYDRRRDDVTLDEVVKINICG